MELRDLEYFVAIAHHGSLARASAALDLSPAALSKSLHRLEGAIDARLMERTTKGVTLTGSGQLLLSRAGVLRLALNDVKREAAEMAAGRAGLIHVGVNQIDCERVAVACAGLLDGAPQLAFEVLVATNDTMVPKLLRGELDIVVSISPAEPMTDPHAGASREILFTDKMVVCASPNHPLTRRRRVSAADAARYRWVLNAAEVRSRGALEAAFSRCKLPPPDIALESSSLQVRLASLANSHALGFQSRRLIRQTAATPYRSVELPIDELAWPISVGVMCRKNGYLPRAARQLIQVLRTSVRWEG